MDLNHCADNYLVGGRVKELAHLKAGAEAFQKSLKNQWRSLK
jgi:hypothetical protein